MKMKKKFLHLWVLLLAAVLFCSACAPSVPALEPKGDDFADSQSGTVFRLAPRCYQPVSVTDEVRSRIPHKKGDDLLLYAVEGMEPSQWLASTERDLFYAVDKVSLPALWDMQVQRVTVNHIQNPGVILAQPTAEETAELIRIYREAASFPSESYFPTVAESYEVHFFGGGDFAGLEYRLLYLHYTSEVTLTEPIADAENFEPAYPGVKVTTQVYDGELFAVYHFGTEILYNEATGTCCMAGEVLQSLWKKAS